MSTPSARAPRIGLLALAGVALALRLAIAWQPVELLTAKTLPDDAFYYFGVARHLAAGDGVTFDGRTVTNGFHPLWLALITPLYALAGGDELPIHLALTLAALLDVGAGVLVFWTARRVAGSAWAGLLSAAFYLLNAAIILESQNGLETALSQFLFIALFAFYRARLAGPDATRRPAWDYLCLGALAGLMTLARTDAIFLAALIGVALLWRGRQAMLGRLAIAAAAGAAVLAPWFLWSWLTLGTPWQSSGSAMPAILRQLYQLAIHDAGLAPFDVWRSIAGNAIRQAAAGFVVYAGVALLAIILALGFWRMLRPRLPSGRWREALAPAGPFWLPLTAVLIMLSIHTLVRWYPRSWYFAPAALTVALPVGPLLLTVRQRTRGLLRRPAMRIATFFVLIYAIFAIQGGRTWSAGVYPWQAGFLAGAEWARQHTAPDDVIGAFNAGILGYFSERETVNLDGVTDFAAQRALAARQVVAYAGERRLRYVIDHSAYVEGMYPLFYGRDVGEWLRPVATAGAPDWRYGTVTVYAVQ